MKPSTYAFLVILKEYKLSNPSQETLNVLQNHSFDDIMDKRLLDTI